MYLPEFEYFAPQTVAEACSLLSEFKGRVKLMAGGTDLLVSMKQKVKDPGHVVALKRIPDLSYIREDANNVNIGIMTTIAALERSNEVNARLQVLADAARSVASPNLRNAGTVGGNVCLDTRCCYYNKSDSFRESIGACLKFGGDVCHVAPKGKKCFAISQGDTVPALIALGASAVIRSAHETKSIPLENLYRDDGKDYLNLNADEMIVEIQIPNPKPHTGGSYQKARVRKATDFALASACVNIAVQNGICEDVRIVLGSLGSSPIRAVKAEEILKGARVTDDVIEEAAERAYKHAKPAANIVKAPPSYRKELARAMTVRAIREALSRVR